MATSSTTSANPWKGLNYYKEGETLFGRSEEVASLSQYIVNNTQTVLYGKSGIGKSSIINAGIFPVARAGGLVPVPLRFEHGACAGYVSQLKDAFLRSGITAAELLPPVSTEREESLWEFFHRHEFVNPATGQPCRPLVVFDQFEEIFTLQRDEHLKREFFCQLADLINEVTPQYITDSQDKRPASVPAAGGAFTLDLGSAEDCEYKQGSDFNLVFVIREDFLSYLERYTVFIPAMKSNRFPLQTINERQAYEIITKPCPGLVSDKVARQIIAKITGVDAKSVSLESAPELEVDSAVLSLFLSRLYLKRESAESVIDQNLVDLHGEDIIRDFYDDALSRISPAKAAYLEDKLVNNDGRRENISRYNAKTEGGLDDTDLSILVDDEKLLRQFPYGGDLRLEFIHDILCPVVRERKERRELVRRQARERVRLLALLAVSFAVILLTFGIISLRWYKTSYVHCSYYTAYDETGGWPVGKGARLSAQERLSSPLYYCLSHKGAAEHDTDVEIMSSNGRLPSGVRISSLEYAPSAEDEYSVYLNDVLSGVSHIRYTGSDDGRISRKELFAPNGTVLLTVSYFYLTDRDAWMQYLTSGGQPRKIRANGIDRARLSWNEDGSIASLMYHDELGVIREICPGVCGYLWTRAEGCEYRYSLNQFGFPSSDVSFNTVIERDGSTEYANSAYVDDPSMSPAADADGVWKQIVCGDTLYRFRAGAASAFATTVYTRDQNGNITEERTSTDGSISYPGIVRRSFADGLKVREELLAADGSPYRHTADGVYLEEWSYYPDGTLKSEKMVLYDGSPASEHTVDISDNCTIDTRFVRGSEPETVVCVDSALSAGVSSRSFFDGGRRPLNRPVTAENCTMQCCRIETATAGRQTTVSYYTAGPGGSIEPIKASTDGFVATSFYRSIKEYDENGQTVSMELLAPDLSVVKSMMYYIQNGHVIGRAVKGIDGTPVRCPQWEEEGFEYYKIYFTKNFDNNYVSVSPVDEWNSRSVLNYDWTDDWYVKVSSRNYKGDYYIYDGLDTSTKMPVMNRYEQFVLEDDDNVSSFRLPYLHVLDRRSPLYSAGLRDSDRIVLLGAWKAGASENLLASEWKRMEAGCKTAITVYRPSGDSYETVNVVPDNAASGKCFAEYHIMNLSASEYARYKQYKNQ